MHDSNDFGTRVGCDPQPSDLIFKVDWSEVIENRAGRVDCEDGRAEQRTARRERHDLDVDGRVERGVAVDRRLGRRVRRGHDLASLDREATIVPTEATAVDEDRAEDNLLSIDVADTDGLVVWRSAVALAVIRRGDETKASTVVVFGAERFARDDHVTVVDSEG
jgi:hypothetical protein